MTVQREVFEINDIDVFDVLNNSFRQRIMRHLSVPRSVKELAEVMDVPVTRLYYHVNRMADSGVISVVDERKVGAILEKVYRTSATSFAPGKELLEGGHDPAELARVAVGVVLDRARVDAELALTEHFSRGGPPQEAPGAIGRGHSLMSPKRAREFADRVGELLNEMEQDDEGGDATEYALSISFFPTSSPA